MEEKGSTSEIVIPPGGLIQLDLSVVNVVSEKKYSLYLMQRLDTSVLVDTKVELDTDVKADFFRRILPKAFVPQGPLVTKVTMDYRGTPWFAMLFPEMVIKPTLETTLVYNLLSNYPGRSLGSYTYEEVTAIQNEIVRIKAERMALFGIPENFNPDHLYVFLRNGLSASVQFLTFLKQFNINFDFDSNADIISGPLPFNVLNRPPVIDEKATTKLIQQRVQEEKSLEVKATARDPDSDQVFYAWMLEGQLITAEEGVVRWIPSYDHGRVAPYTISVLVSDGGKITRVDWPVLVENVNRRPTFAHNCDLKAIEGVEWVCRVSFSDPDGEAVNVKTEAIDGSNPLYLNGQSAPVQISGQNSVEIRWTPNNEDAKKRSASIILELVDASFGLTLASLNVTVDDNNVSPIMLGGINTDASGAIEYDYCAQADPDGLAPYKFYLDFQDPNNVGSNPAVPADEIIVTTSGTLNSNIKLLTTETFVDRVRYSYEWRPTHALKTGTFIVSLKDNHGGVTPLITLNLTSSDRNTVPCLVAASGVTAATTSVNDQNPQTFSVSDRDSDPLFIELANFSNLDHLKFLEDCNTAQPIAIKRNIARTIPTYRKNASSLCIRHYFSSNGPGSGIAGHVLFTRTEDTANRTIPKDLTLTSNLAGYLMQFKTAVAVTVEPGDLDIYVPVYVVNRTAAANTLTVLDYTTREVTSDPIDTNIQVRNDSSITEKGMVTFYRSTANASAIILGKGLTIKTAGNPSFEFELPDNFTFPASASATLQTLTVPVWKKALTIPTGTSLTISSQPGGPVMTATSVVGLGDTNDIELQVGKSQQEFRTYNVRAIDGARPAVNTINIFHSTKPAEAANLTVTNPTVFYHEGKLKFTRPSGGTAFTLPAGFVLRTANYTKYELVDALSFTTSDLTKTVWVRRINNIGLTTTTPYVQERLVRHNFNDLNNASRLVTSSVIQAYEGVPFTGGVMEFNDNAEEIPSPLYQVDNYWYPKDKYDYHSFSFTNAGPVPAAGFGAFKFCREPGAFAATPCTACTTSPPPAGWKEYYKSSRCYLRYNPNVNDLSGSFTIKATLREHWPYSTATAATTVNITFNYIENNDAPKITNSSFAVYGGGVGSTHTNPITLGDFSEGVAGLYNIYVTDENKGEELRTVNFEMDPQVYDLKTSTWRPIPPGLRVDVETRNHTALFGSKTTAKITWTPTDEEAKKFSGTSGFVIKMRVYDAKTTPNIQQQTFGYYKVTLTNKNQVPSIGALAPDNKFRIYADTYFSKEFYLYDGDAFTPDGGTFATKLTLCRDSNSNSNPIQHPTLDSGSADPFICHAKTPTWAQEIATYDAGYLNNRTLPSCAPGGVLNQDLAIPKLSPVGAPELDGALSRQKYIIEWCPQRGHIGEHSAEIFVNDNGDTNRDGLSLARAISASPLRFTIVAPVFLVSPRNDVNGNPVHHMQQTAANMAANPFRYEMIVNNSQGNKLEYSLLTSPRDCALPNGMCIDKDKGIITWNPSYPSDVTPDGGDGHLVRVRVRDTVTGDVDTAHFNLKVQNPLSPYEEAPTIDSSLPAGTDILVAEKQSLTLSVSASDINTNDQLFYRWYINGVLKSDEGSSFVFKPTDTDGSLDPDGAGPLKVGEFKIRVEVTDGNYIVSRGWNARIRNTFLLGETMFDLTASRPESAPSQLPYDLNWLLEAPVSSQVGSDSMDRLIISGTYKIGVFTKHFLWDLLMLNGAINKPNGSLVNPPWNFMEDLPWQGTTKSDRLAITQSGTSYNILITSKAARGGPFGETTEALRIPGGDLTGLSLSTNNKCIGECPEQLYTSATFSDDRLTESMDSLYVFYASDNRDKLFYDPLTPASPTTIYNFGANAKISGMKLNRSINRLYVTTQQTSPSISHTVWVFNVTPVLSGSVPTLVAQLAIFDGVGGHEDCKPTDVVVDASTNRVFILLTGTGGLATFPDSSSTTPTVGQIQFIGVNEISSSPFDIPGAGRRLIVREEDRLVIGTMRDSNQVFTVDMDSFAVYTNSTQDPIDSLVSYPSGQLVLVSRSKGRIYKAK
ncbi:hypothetical protein [Bdellovibrio bacteriovorus]|uniref:hypothetical protein n=1 Tax=Bdellovibrio bacteriovorus TaxID=959 RepID=UPI0035A84792